MTRILLVGICGHMGHAITEAALNQKDQFTIVAGVDCAGTPAAEIPVYQSIEDVKEDFDVIVDFSALACVETSLRAAVKLSKPVIIGTTGLGERHKQLLREAAVSIPVFQTGNMSIGVNLQMNLIRQAEAALGAGFDVEIVETHHRRKLDAPSGTAQMLADCVRSEMAHETEVVCGRHGTSCKRKDNEISISSVRGGTIVGEHEVKFLGEDEVIEVNHRAYSKRIFAVGALRAAAYIVEKTPGLYNMQDVINDGDVASHVSCTPDQAVIHLYGIKSGEVFREVFHVVAEAGVGVDMISYVPSYASRSLGFTVDRRQLSDATNALMPLIAREGLNIRTESDAVKLVVEGPGMARRTGVASDVFDVLYNSKIDLLLVTTGETKIEVCVPAVQGSFAMEEIERKFGK